MFAGVGVDERLLIAPARALHVADVPWAIIVGTRLDQVPRRARQRPAARQRRRHVRQESHLHVELKTGEAAGLKRLADETGWSEAMAVLYPHIDQEIRANQTREILRALARIHEVGRPTPIPATRSSIVTPS